ncbi:MAG: hypothetical protein QOE33_1739 [Acidobacteriota bacterium]|nr:hypothetical protein [Acidobacteriota bacterium]
MQCPRCWQDVPQHSAFCLHCGHEIASTLVAPRRVEPLSTTKEHHQGWTPTMIVLIIVAIVAGLVGCVAIIVSSFSQSAPAQHTQNNTTTNTPSSKVVNSVSPTPIDRNSNSDPSLMPSPTPRQNAPALSSEPATTSPSERRDANANYYPPNSSPQPEPQNQIPVLAQTFEVSPQQYHTTEFNVPHSGAHIVGRFQAISGDNIKAHILDTDGLVNFQHHNAFRSYYSSDKTAVGRIDIRLSPGVYYLVFENSYSIFSHKVVSANVMMEY